MAVHREFYTKFGEDEVRKANLLIKALHGCELPPEVLTESANALGKTIASGSTIGNALQQVVEVELGYAHEDRRQLYMDALREMVWIRYDFVKAYAMAHMHIQQPDKPLRYRKIVRGVNDNGRKRAAA